MSKEKERLYQTMLDLLEDVPVDGRISDGWLDKALKVLQDAHLQAEREEASERGHWR